MDSNFYCGSEALHKAVHAAKIKALFDETIPNKDRYKWFIAEVKKLLGETKAKELETLLEEKSKGMILP